MGEDQIQERRQKKGFRFRHSILITAFLSALWLPAIQMKWHLVEEPRNTENRELARLPEGKYESAAQFVSDWENYISDHFGFRPYLIRWNSLLRLYGLGVSPVPAVVLGKDSWLFYCSEALADGNTFDDFRGNIRLDPSDLIALQEKLEANQKIFSQNQIVYLLVIAPNKNTIYSEYLPEGIGNHRPPTRLDQFTEHMKAHSRVPVLDLRKALLSAKDRYPVYWKTDSHWNRYGAYIGYVEIFNHLSRYLPGLKAIPMNCERITVERSPTGGDLAQMLSIPDILSEDFDTRVSLKVPENLPLMETLVFRHDSFGDNLYPYLTKHCKRLINIAPFAPYKFEELIRLRPQAVIHIFAERYLTQAIHDDFFYSP